MAKKASPDLANRSSEQTAAIPPPPLKRGGIRQAGATAGQMSNGAVPETLVTYALLAGAFLVILGIGLLIAGAYSVTSSLTTCVGFGLLLAAFGSRAAGSWGGWSASGAGAMAVLLFMLLQHYSPNSVMDPVKRGQIRGDFTKVADIRIVDESPLYEYRDPTTSSLKFVILDTALHSQRLLVQVDTTERGSGKEFFELVGSAKVITEKYLKDTGPHSHLAQWTFDFDRRTIKDGGVVLFAEADQLDDNLLPKPLHASLAWPSFVSPAEAETDEATHSPADVTEGGRLAISKALDSLKDEDPAVRRNARDTLADIGLPAVEPMMSVVRSNPENYRLKGGAIYVLSTLLRRSPSSSGDISSRLKDEDFPVLVSAASDDDKTLRMQASELLYLLGDPRSIPYSVEAARKTDDPNKAANQVSIVGQAGQKLSPIQQQNIIRDITSGPGQNNDLVGSHGWVRQKLGF